MQAFVDDIGVSGCEQVKELANGCDGPGVRAGGGVRQLVICPQRAFKKPARHLQRLPDRAVLAEIEHPWAIFLQLEAERSKGRVRNEQLAIAAIGDWPSPVKVTGFS